MYKQILKILSSGYPTVLYTILLLSLCLIPGSALVESGIVDTWTIILHFSEFLVLGFIVIFYFRKTDKTIIYCLTIAIVTELIQYFVPGRFFDIFDIEINLLGSITGIALGSLIKAPKIRS